MKKRSILLILVIIAILGIVIYWFWLDLRKGKRVASPSQTTSHSLSQLIPYQSKSLDFTIQIPKDFNTEEGLTFVEFKKGDSSIGLGRVAHASASLSDYLSDLDEKNKTTKISEIKDLEINGYSVRVRDELRGREKVRLYYIFTPDWVYVFSTKSEELYDDLDQIAKSFRYTP